MREELLNLLHRQSLERRSALQDGFQDLWIEIKTLLKHIHIHNIPAMIKLCNSLAVRKIHHPAQFSKEGLLESQKNAMEGEGNGHQLVDGTVMTANEDVIKQTPRLHRLLGGLAGFEMIDLEKERRSEGERRQRKSDQKERGTHLLQTDDFVTETKAFGCFHGGQIFCNVAQR